MNLSSLFAREVNAEQLINVKIVRIFFEFGKIPSVSGFFLSNGGLKWQQNMI